MNKLHLYNFDHKDVYQNLKIYTFIYFINFIFYIQIYMYFCFCFLFLKFSYIK